MIQRFGDCLFCHHHNSILTRLMAREVFIEWVENLKAAGGVLLMDTLGGIGCNTC
jgi:hypothetical protein